MALRFSVRCGQGKHPVVVEATAWGRVSVANPCDILPSAARKLSRSSCAESLSAILQAIDERLQTVWCPQSPEWGSCALPAVPRQRLDEFIDVLKLQTEKEALAERLLAAPASAAEELPGDAESGDEARCWARLVLAARDPERARPLIATVRRWSPALLVAALCAHDWGADPVGLLLAEQVARNRRVIPSFRARGVATLGEIGDERHTALLVDAVCANERMVQPAAVNGLARLFARFCAQGASGTQRLQHVLAATLDRAAVRFTEGEHRLVEWLTDWARPHLALLLDAVVAGEPPRRVFAARLLERLGDVRAAEALSRAACDRHPEVSQAATSGLVVLRPALVDAGERSVPLLAGVLTGGSERLTLLALDALRQIGSPRAVDGVVGVLRQADAPDLKIAAIAALGALGDERTIDALLPALADRVLDVSQAASQALAAVVGRLARQESSLHFLRRTLASGQRLVVSVSLRRLTDFGSLIAARVVAEALPTLSEDFQVQALMALRELEYAETLSPVLAFLERMPNRPEAEATDQAVLTASSLVRKLAGASGCGLAVLVKTLKCAYLSVAREAARALRTCDDASVVAPLLTACLRGDGPLSAAAGACLKRLATAEQLAWLTQFLWHGDDRMARGAEAALIAVGQRAVEPLIPAVNWPYVRARLAAVRALGKIGTPPVAAVLQGASKDEHPRVREMATAALRAFQLGAAPK